MKKRYGLLILFLVLSFPLIAQVSVDSSAGTDAEYAETKLILKTAEELVPVYLVTGESSSYALGSSASGDVVSVSGGGVNTKLICEAPAELTLQGGVYQFQIIPNPILNGRFKVSSTGGTQVWEVNKKWGQGAIPLIMSGSTSLAGGALLLIFGFILDDATAFLVSGGVMGGYGIVASILGWTHKPTAKLVEVRDN